MKKLLFTSTLILLAGMAFSQNRTKDEAAINAAVDAMIFSWNNHNYDDLKNYTTEDTDWVNGVGMWWRGRKDSQYAHQVYHDTMFKNSVLEKRSVALKFVTKDVAIAHIEWHFSSFTAPDGEKPATDCIAQIVYVNQNGKWLMSAGENVPVVKEVQQFDPIKQKPKK